MFKLSVNQTLRLYEKLCSVTAATIAEFSSDGHLLVYETSFSEVSLLRFVLLPEEYGCRYLDQYYNKNNVSIATIKTTASFSSHTM